MALGVVALVRLKNDIERQIAESHVVEATGFIVIEGQRITVDKKEYCKGGRDALDGVIKFIDKELKK